MYDSVFINGSVGVGKTTVGESLSILLGNRGTPCAFIDMDALRQRRPRRPEDPWQSTLALRNLRSVAANYRDDGVGFVVAAGVLESPVESAGYADVLGPGDTLFVRLTADEAVIAARLRQRHVDDPEGLRWHLERHPQLEGILDAADIPHDLVLDVGDVTPDEVAARIAEQITATQSDPSR